MNESLESLRAYARKLVAVYTVNGLSGISKADMQLLLSEKQLHLAAVCERCSLGREMHLSVPLKRILEQDVREIGQAMEGQMAHDNGLER